MSFGERYIEVSNFITYCRDLNIDTDERELEYYEEKGIMLPVMREVLPEEFVKRAYQWQFSSTTLNLYEGWSEVAELYDKIDIDEKTTDEELIDSFDRMYSHTPYLVKPLTSSFQPWDSYKVVVAYSEAHSRFNPTARHFYSYWQAYQLYLIKQFPDLYINLTLINNLDEKVKERLGLPRAWNLERYQSFEKKANFFDALSYYFTLANREKERTFATT